MIVKKSGNNFSKHIALYNYMKRRKTVFAALILILVALYSSVLFITGAVAHKIGFIANLKSAIISNYRTQVNFIKGLTAQPADNISIDIDFESYQKLAYKREIALNKRMLISNSTDYVDARIKYNEEEHGVKIRLKGDAVDHYKDDKKWSFRVKVKGDNTIDGMKMFSLNVPSTRSFIFEWLFLEAAKREGLIALRFKFVNVSINGEKRGIYIMEEHFDKILIEHNERKEGVIIKFNESSWWLERDHALSDTPEADVSLVDEYSNYYSLPIDLFKSKKTLNDSILMNQYKHAFYLLENFRIKKLLAHEVFDIEKMAKYFALLDLFGGHHALHTNQYRFYYNPISSLLEPVPFNVEPGNHISTIIGSKGNKVELWRGSGGVQFVLDVISDPIFIEEYLKFLSYYSNDIYLASFFEEIEEDLTSKLGIIYSEYPLYYFDRTTLYINRNVIRKKLNPYKVLLAYCNNIENSYMSIFIGNIQPLPIEIGHIIYNDSVTFKIDTTTIIKGKPKNKITEYNNVRFKIPRSIDHANNIKNNIAITYKIVGLDELRKDAIIPYPYFGETYSNVATSGPIDIEKLSFIEIINKDKIILLKPGTWVLDKNVVIPKGFKAIGGGGLIIDLIKNARIVSHSPVQLCGSEENPIVITSSDSTGQGLFVLSTTDESILNFVQFRNLSNPSENGWELTGAVTFYEADVSISNCLFSNNQRGDDFVNIIRSEYDIDNTYFRNVISDAFDSDFCTGTISHSSFINCGNDAVDISGTNIEINNVIIDYIGDKGLSSGENSQMQANNVKITNSEIAICSKDLSKITISNVYLQDNRIGFTAFQKKPEFGPGYIEGARVDLINVSIPYLIEKKSSCSIDGRIIKPGEDKVKDLLYGVKYGKSSK